MRLGWRYGSKNNENEHTISGTAPRRLDSSLLVEAVKEFTPMV
jgi:hypothetical protein